MQFHFHAIYGEYEAMIRIADLGIEKGELPTKQFKKVKKWATDKQDALRVIFEQFNPDLK
ncbi:MAG: DUF4160 domain-containing protein [Bacteroidales bacterium]|nr:DUF4160 domain-containing protein [Bacteroidales bacterium]